MSVNSVLVKNLTTNQISVDGGEYRFSLTSLGTHSIPFNLFAKNYDLCSQLSTFVERDKIQVLVGGREVSAAIVLAYGRGANMLKAEYDVDNNAEIDYDAVAPTVSRYEVVELSASTYNAQQVVGTVVLLCNTTSNNITITLPTAVGSECKFIIKKVAGLNDVILITTSSQTIDGYSNYSLTTLNQSETLISGGANWFLT